MPGTPTPAPSPISRASARAFDSWAERTLGLPTLVLMENAGRGAADCLLELLKDSGDDPTDSRVLVVCGWGNNGGDGGVLARRLLLRRVPVRLVWFGTPDRASPEASIQFEILKRLGVDQIMFGSRFSPADLAPFLSEADWIVDALLGTGPSSPIREPFVTIINNLNQSGKPIFSLDLPSGLDADLGVPLGVSIIARATATFVAPKLGFTNPDSARLTGPIHVVDIGLPPEACPTSAS